MIVVILGDSKLVKKDADSNKMETAPSVEQPTTTTATESVAAATANGKIGHSLLKFSCQSP